jgi:hypothetical protein
MDRNPYDPDSHEGRAWTDGWLWAEGLRREGRAARVAEANRETLELAKIKAGGEGPDLAEVRRRMSDYRANGGDL